MDEVVVTQTPLPRHHHRAVQQVDRGSTIVALPGDPHGPPAANLIAAAAAATACAVTGRPVLLLVPNQQLLDRHAHVLAAETCLRVATHPGDLAAVSSCGFDALLATAADYLALAASTPGQFALQSFGLLVLEEAHLVIQRHPYSVIASLLQRLPPRIRPKVLGLTSDPGERKDDADALCSALGLPSTSWYRVDVDGAHKNDLGTDSCNDRTTPPTQAAASQAECEPAGVVVAMPPGDMFPPWVHAASAQAAGAGGADNPPQLCDRGSWEWQALQSAAVGGPMDGPVGGPASALYDRVGAGGAADASVLAEPPPCAALPAFAASTARCPSQPPAATQAATHSASWEAHDAAAGSVADGAVVSVPAQMAGVNRVAAAGSERLGGSGQANASGRGDRSLLIPGPPHMKLDTILRLVGARSVPPLDELTLLLFNTIQACERGAAEADGSFQSPLFNGTAAVAGKKANRMFTWGEYAFKRLQVCSSAESCRWLELLEHLYEAARLVVSTAQEGLELALMYLDMTLDLADPALARLAAEWQRRRGEFSRAAYLKQVLLQARHTHGDSLRCVVYVEHRAGTHVLEHFVNHDRELASLTTTAVYADGTATPRLRIRRPDVVQKLRRFADGDVQVMFATTVLFSAPAAVDMGVDDGSANCIVRFDTMQATLAAHGLSAKRMQSTQLLPPGTQDVASSALPSNKQPRTHVSADPDEHVLLKRFVKHPKSYKKRALKVLKEYATTVAAQLQEKPHEHGSARWTATVVFSLRDADAVVGHGNGATKTWALNAASFDVLSKLSKQHGLSLC